MTREHVIPAFLYALQKSFGEKTIGWNEVVGKMVGGEAKVRDVCEECNSGVLSELDSYGQKLLEGAGTLVHNFEGRRISVPYNYSLLLRWLLKISFNSSRTDGAHSHLFEEFIPFILGEAAVPPRQRVGLIAYLASAVPLTDQQIGVEPFATAARRAKSFNPLVVRISYGAVPGDSSFTLRINILGPVVFFMPIFNPDVRPGHAAASLRRLAKLQPRSVELTSKMRRIELVAGPKTWHDLYSDQLQRTRALQRAA